LKTKRYLIALAVLVTAMLIIAGWRASLKNTPTFTAERTIQKLPPKGTDEVVDKDRCGDYFIHGRFHIGDSADAQACDAIHDYKIGYVLETLPSDPPDAVVSGLFAPDKFHFEIVEQKIKPTVRLEMDANGNVVGVHVKISLEDYQNGEACLPMKG
jgi:hypothetical protein